MPVAQGAAAARQVLDIRKPICLRASGTLADGHLQFRTSLMLRFICGLQQVGLAGNERLTWVNASVATGLYF